MEKTQVNRKNPWRNLLQGEGYYDYNLLIIIIFLTSFGLIMLYSSSAFTSQRMHGDDMFLFSRQVMFSIGGMVLMILVSFVNYRVYAPIAFQLFVVSFLFLVLVQTPFGIEVNGARRWLPLIGSIRWQPSELSKVTIILFTAYELCRLGQKAYTLRGAVRVVLVFGGGMALGVMFLTENLSTAIIVFAVAAIIYFVVHPKFSPFIAIGVTGLVSLAVFLNFVIHSLEAGGSFRMQRIITWLNPEQFAGDTGFQVIQGLYAIGAGGFWGRGLGNSTQKIGLIPEVQNDMILAVVIEELGVFGAILLLLLFAMLLYRLMFIAQNASDLFGSLIAIGVFAHIAVQVIFNVAVVTNVIPTTGITLPFVSYGGTSVFFLMAEMGIVLNVARQIKIEDTVRVPLHHKSKKISRSLS